MLYFFLVSALLALCTTPLLSFYQSYIRRVGWPKHVVVAMMIQHDVHRVVAGVIPLPTFTLYYVARTEFKVSLPVGVPDPRCKPYGGHRS